MKLLLASIIPILFGVPPALSQETSMDRCLAIYSQAECDRLQNTFVEPESKAGSVAETTVVGDVQPARVRHGAGWMCEPEQNPPAAWLRLGGFCHQICSPANPFVNAACIGKNSLVYTGADPVFDTK